MSNIQIVKDFIQAWNDRDLEGILNRFTEDAFYHNIPMDPMIGRDAIRAGLEAFVGMVEEVDWEILAIAEDSSGRVLTERIDNFKNSKGTMSLPVMGTFEIENGKIAKWRDYFDMGQFQTEMAKLQ